MTFLKSAFTLTVLGSGTCVPSLERSSCSILIRGKEETILVDVGAGTLRQLLKAGSSIFEIDFLLLSHFHPDHAAELPSFLFSTKYPDISRRTSPLTLAGGDGFQRFFELLNRAFNDYLTLPEPLMNRVELSGYHPPPLRGRYFTIESSPVNHRPESRAFRITAPDGTAMVYSGDTGISEDLVLLATDADLMVCECSLPDENRVKGHLTPSLAGEMATNAGVKALVLTHLYPECDGVDIEGQCRKTWSGPLVVARDLMVID